MPQAPCPCPQIEGCPQHERISLRLAQAHPCGCPGRSLPIRPGCPGQCPRGDISGILNLDKPAGWTSHDVVARVRRLTGQRRVGHAGALDPFATGVLLICLGQATRVSEYLMEAPKLYRARIRFGTATDTYDLTGAVTAQSDTIPSQETIEGLLPCFVGRILQRPPAYSALKQAGEPAYRRARRGEAVAPTARPIEIYGIRLRSWTPPDLEIEVRCGKGTYIRSLAHDLGLAAGSAAHLAALQRRAVGHFTIEEAIPLAELEASIEQDGWREFLYPLDEALLHYPALVLPAEDIARLLHGQPVAAGPVTGGEIRRVYGTDGEFIALVQGDAQAGLWRPHKVFAVCA